MRNTSPRTNRAIVTQLTIVKAMNTPTTPRPISTVIKIIIKRSGKANTTSTTRIIRLSVFPPT